MITLLLLILIADLIFLIFLIQFRISKKKIKKQIRSYIPNPFNKHVEKKKSDFVIKLKKTEPDNEKVIDPTTPLYMVRDKYRPRWENYAIECNTYLEHEEEQEKYQK